MIVGDIKPDSQTPAPFSPETAETPADSKIGGFGRVDGRPVVVCSYDFTVLAATSSRVASHKKADLRSTQ